MKDHISQHPAVKIIQIAILKIKIRLWTMVVHLIKSMFTVIAKLILHKWAFLMQIMIYVKMV